MIFRSLNKRILPKADLSRYAGGPAMTISTNQRLRDPVWNVDRRSGSATVQFSFGLILNYLFHTFYRHPAQKPNPLFLQPGSRVFIAQQQNSPNPGYCQVLPGS